MLRRRLVAELFGDSDAVAATLDADFQLVMHMGGTTTTLPGGAVIEGVKAQTASGVLMWVEFDDLLIDGQVIAGNGVMCSLLVPARALTTMPVALFLRCTDDHMTSEIAFMGTPTTAVIDGDAMPSVQRLHSHLDQEGLDR